MPALPNSLSSAFLSFGSRADSIFASSSLSTLVSTRLTKKLATLATLLRSPPRFFSFSRPERNASATSA